MNPSIGAISKLKYLLLLNYSGVINLKKRKNVCFIDQIVIKVAVAGTNKKNLKK